MKILYFTLGSPAIRFYGKVKNGYDKFFNEDIIFYGPSKDSEFVYNGKSFKIIQLEEEISIFDLLHKLPKGWAPDIVTCETVILTYIKDFYKCPYKTICFARDSWGEVIYNPNIVEFFDYVYYQTVDIKNIQLNYKTNLIPIIGSPVSVNNNIKKINYTDRQIDILVIANYNSGFYHERYKLLSLVSKNLSKMFNIKFLTGVPQDDIHKYYQNSKIVVDYSFVMSNRSYEAINNGCLLFSNENNPLIKEVWTPGVDYIAYNLSNITSLLKKYLLNITDSLLIVSNASEKIKTLSNTPGDVFIKRIKNGLKINASSQKRIERINSWETSMLHYCLSTPLYFNYNYSGHNHPYNWRKLYFERINKALDNNPQGDLKIKELIEASRMSFLLKEENKFFDYISELEKIIPEYAWIYYLKARIYFDSGEYKKVLNNLNKAIHNCNSFPYVLQKFILPFVEKKNACDGRRIVDYLWQSVYNHGNEFQIKAFLNEVYTLLAQTNESIGKIEKATKNYLMAVSEVSIPASGHLAYKFLVKQNDYIQIKTISKNVVAENPYDFLSVLYLSLSLSKLKKRKENQKVLSDYRLLINSFYYKRKTINKINMKKIIVQGLLFLNNFPFGISSFATNKIIKKVGNKL